VYAPYLTLPYLTRLPYGLLPHVIDIQNQRDPCALAHNSFALTVCRQIPLRRKLRSEESELFYFYYFIFIILFLLFIFCICNSAVFYCTVFYIHIRCILLYLYKLLCVCSAFQLPVLINLS